MQLAAQEVSPPEPRGLRGGRRGAFFGAACSSSTGGGEWGEAGIVARRAAGEPGT